MEHRPILDPLRRFVLAVLLCTVVAVGALGAGVERLLTRNVLDREGRVTAEAVRLLVNLDLDRERFHAAAQAGDSEPFAHVAQHLTSIPEIMRVKIYDAQGTIVWSDEPRAIGQRYADNHELAEALEGELEVEMGLLKTEHLYEAEHFDERRLLEVYVPLITRDGEVYGVMEVYKHPVTFFHNLDTARRILWALCAGIAVALVLSLGRIFVRARRTEATLHARTREVEAQLVQAEKLGVVGEMAAAIAHEINNPLGILTGKINELDAMAGTRGCPEACRSDFAVFRHEIARISEVLRSLLVFARKSDVHLAPTDLNEIVAETARFVGASFARANVRVLSSSGSGPLSVRADANQLKQVLLNLLQNAKDAMPDGGTIHLRTRTDGDRATVEIVDDGSGMTPEVLHRVFEPFFSTKRNGHGSGLGLSVSYGIIKEHGGVIEVTSEAGHGSTFRVVLPALT